MNFRVPHHPPYILCGVIWGLFSLLLFYKWWHAITLSIYFEEYCKPSRARFSCPWADPI
ncbi:hypothetical protein BJX63DRAFT_413799 [Aspergillus granulosus]|uniref:Uncharacterized protein n=1 Tax=Aspergillus granulosus TaxID=176169 RepID=A0ABR4GUR5_9EURO